MRLPIKAVVAVALFVACVFLLFTAISVGSGKVAESYRTAKETVAEETYDTFYERSYNSAETAHHVSNNVSVAIDSLSQEADLEVLRVSEITCVLNEDCEEGSALEKFQNLMNGSLDESHDLLVTGTGVFTVDLQASEIIIDEEHNYVLIRIPEPEITEFNIDTIMEVDYENGEISEYSSNDEETEGDGEEQDNVLSSLSQKLSNLSGVFTSSSDGIHQAVEVLQAAQTDLKQKMNENQTYYRSACDSAVNFITTSVKELDPDLTVEVEFIN